jgi:hypothetical protein
MTGKLPEVHFPVFGYTVYVCYTDNIPEDREGISHIVGAVEEPLTTYCDGLHSYHKRKPDCCIFFTPESSIGTITHECYHAIRRMWKWIGAKPEEEITAYHLGYLVDKVLKIKKLEDGKRTSISTD